MCGIAGTIDFAGRVDPAVLSSACAAAIEHRGPDSRGIWCEGGVGLGMQRLAIIDLDGGDQPIFNEDGSIAVVMNGEIYNFETLRVRLDPARVTRSLPDRTPRCSSTSTRSYGERLVDRLRGMFAFAIWDARQRQLLLARDRVGQETALRRTSRDQALVRFRDHGAAPGSRDRAHAGPSGDRELSRLPVRSASSQRVCWRGEAATRIDAVVTADGASRATVLGTRLR